VTASRPAIPVALVHLGCARNLIDSELILARMAEEGLMVTGDVDQSEVVVINTCSFIGPARAESVGAIKKQLAQKRRGRRRAVVVAGCLVQRYKRALLREFPDVDLWAEISDYRALARSVRELGQGQGVPAYLEAVEARASEREDARLLATPGSYAYLRISHGCDHQCSFCAIPVMRGKHRSKALPAVLSEAQELIEHGVKELVLVAEDSTAWGREWDLELPDLVAALADLPGEQRVRIMYAYPNRFPWRLTELMREHPKVLPYLDIPVQHIATPVLRAMRRHGSGDQVRKILDRLREEVPGITLRTTLLMGFPGETDADAAEAVQFVRDYGLGRLGTFTYSPEEGTSGFALEGRIDPDLAETRAEAVRAARDEVLAASQRALLGRELEVLIDELHPAEAPGEMVAVARPNLDAPEVDLLATFRGFGLKVGQRLRVTPTELDEQMNLVCAPVGQAPKAQSGRGPASKAHSAPSGRGSQPNQGAKNQNAPKTPRSPTDRSDAAGPGSKSTAGADKKHKPDQQPRGGGPGPRR
jgi:ribosomal protein S12 methylthiotransferase